MHMHRASLIDPPSSGTPGPCACTTLRKAARALSRVYEGALEQGGVTATQFAILRELEREGGVPLSRLAEQLVMDRTSLYRAIRPLIVSGAVAVDPAAAGRTKLASLTPAGAAAIARALPCWESAQAAFLAAYGADEWQALAKTLLAVVATAAELPGA
jgi:DNA-binding MarR family transcriptional regulator